MYLSSNRGRSPSPASSLAVNEDVPSSPPSHHQDDGDGSSPVRDLDGDGSSPVRDPNNSSPAARSCSSPYEYYSSSSSEDPVEFSPTKRKKYETKELDEVCYFR